MILSQSLSPVVLRNGMNVAFRYYKETIRYREFWETTNRYSYFLQKEIGYELRVALWMSNSPYIAQCFIALSNIKCCTVPINPEASIEENLFKLKDASVSVILCTADHVKTVNKILQDNNIHGITVIDMEGKRCTEYDPTFSPSPQHQPNENDNILLFYTPGTTGKYKGCLFNHKAVISSMTSVKNAQKFQPIDNVFSQLPMATPFPFMHFLMAPLMAGAANYISDATDYEGIISRTVEFRVTRMAPRMRSFMGMLQYSFTEKMPMVTMRSFCFFGKPLHPTLIKAVQKLTKARITYVYGLTEYLGTVAVTPVDLQPDPRRPGLIGPAMLSHKVRVVDDQNDEIDKKKRQMGQLLVMGPALMAKYLELPEEQKQTVRGTWLFTGDVVEIDKEGNIEFLERKADIVSLQNDVKVFPKEVEPIVYQIPQVAECAYICAHDRMKKPFPAVVIVRKEKTTLNEKTVGDFLGSKVPAHKRPKGIFFIDVMPKTISGAINRAKLRSLYDGV